MAAPLPKALRELPHWVLWKLEKRNGKLTKVPYTTTGRCAESDERNTWARYDQVLAVMANGGGYNGVGFMFTGSGLAGVDLDHCVKDEVIEPWAQKIINHLDSYAELSPSGTGVHIIVKGQLPGERRGRRKGNIEMYCAGRYFTITGKRLPEAPNEIEDRQQQLNDMYHEVFAEETQETTTLARQISSGFQGTDDELLELARSAKSGEKFKKIFDDGNIDEYGDDDSRADLALVSMLAFFTGPDPGRIDRLFRRSALVRDKWTKRQDYRDRTIQTALKKCRQFYEPRAESPFQAAKNNKPWMLTDLGNARRLDHYFGHDVRYCAQWGKWLIWNGTRWAIDENGIIFRYAYKISEKLWDECKAATDSDVQSRMSKWAIASQSRTRIDAMIYLARSLSKVAVTAESFDRDSMLLNCQNGTVDLRTGKLKTHDPTDMITRMCPVSYDEEASCPLWLKVLNRIMAGNEVLIGYLQRVFGYCLTGKVTEQILAIFYGVGANGKTLTCETVTNILGDYAGESPPDLLVVGRNEHPTEIADLCGRRLVVATETEQGSRMRIQLVKRLTGNTKLKARYMRQDYFEFPRTHKMILCTNNKPVVEEQSNAIWRRLKLVPFSVTIPDGEQDKELLSKLKAEWSGILTWMVQGCLAWQQNGLMEPEEVIEATGEYRHSQNPLHDFFEDCCRFGPFAVTPVSVLKEKYESWASERGHGQTLSATEFNKELRKKGCEYGTKYWGGESQKCWTGLDLQGQE